MKYKTESEQKCDMNMLLDRFRLDYRDALIKTNKAYSSKESPIQKS